MIDIKRGIREAKNMHRTCIRMIKRFGSPVIEMTLVLAVVPALFQAYLYAHDNSALLAAWDAWHAAFVSGNTPKDQFIPLVLATMQGAQGGGNGAWLYSLLYSLFLVPLIFSATALLFNGYASNTAERPSVSTTRMALSKARKLVLVAILCMLAQSFLRLLPEIAAGLVSAIAGLLSFIPFIGAVSVEISVVFSVLVSLATDFAIATLFCYVWICAVCEDCGGFSAITRSIFYVHGNMHETIATLLTYMLCRWLLVLVIGGLWFFVGASSGVSFQALVYLYYCVEAVSVVWLAALTCTLYQGIRNNTNRGRSSVSEPPNLDQMKRANINE